MKQMRYTKMDLERDFPTNEACLNWIMNWLYPEGMFCKKCLKVTPHYKDKGLPTYSCRCGTHVSPMANTIFHKSTTPLTMWFYAIYLMSATRAGISAKQLERELGVTYKTAWRMFHQIRKLMADSSGPLTGEVEIDEMYLGANPVKRSTAKAHHNQVVFGATERSGRAKVRHLDSGASALLLPAVEKAVDKKARIYSDGLMAYRNLYWMGYKHKSIDHRIEHVSRADATVHTQNIENLWSNMKRGIKGVYRHVGPNYLQAYADEYAFRYSHRNDYEPMFWSILKQVVSSPPAAK
jgi:transposase